MCIGNSRWFDARCRFSFEDSPCSHLLIKSCFWIHTHTQCSWMCDNWLEANRLTFAYSKKMCIWLNSYMEHSNCCGQSLVYEWFINNLCVKCPLNQTKIDYGNVINIEPLFVYTRVCERDDIEDMVKYNVILMWRSSKIENDLWPRNNKIIVQNE